MKKIPKKINLDLLVSILEVLLIIATFLLPLLLSVRTNLYLFYLATITVTILAVLNIWLKHRQKNVNRKNYRSRTILSNINLLFDNKSECIRNSTYHPLQKDRNYPLFYNVHNYIREVCLNLRNTVASIIEAESEYVDVALIYKYKNESDWKWLSGKSGTSGAKELNEFMREPCLFNYIAHTNEIVFYNNKADCKFYIPKRRDKFFMNKGSIMAMPLTYYNNEDGLIDFILVISTYGVRFIESNNQKAVSSFRETLIYEILPYYISLMQIPFGEMYIRHNINNPKKKPVFFFHKIINKECNS